MTQTFWPSALGPYDLQVMQTVFDKISQKPWFSKGSAYRAEFARYIMQMYVRGLVIPDKLEDLCRIAARKKFSSRSGIDGYRFLVVEDDYFVASDAKNRLESLGANVLPVPTLKDAMIAAEYEHDLDGALLDINLRGEMVYPAAALLTMRRIPFAFITGYDNRVLPPSYRSADVFTKPTDWAVVAAHVAQRALL